MKLLKTEFLDRWRRQNFVLINGNQSSNDLHITEDKEACQAQLISYRNNWSFHSIRKQTSIDELHKDETNDSDNESYNFEYVRYSSSCNKYYMAVKSAIANNCEELLSYIKDLDLSLNAQNPEGFTLLHFAVRGGSRKTAELLIKLGADLNCTTRNGRTALEIAARTGSKKCLQLLVKYHCIESKMHCLKNPNKPKEQAFSFLRSHDLNGDNLLHLACKQKKKHCLIMTLRCMLKYLEWTDVEGFLGETNLQNHTPIHLACLWRNAENVDILLIETMMKSVIRKVCPLLKVRKISSKLVEASRHTLLWNSTSSGTVLHELASTTCVCNKSTADGHVPDVKNEKKALVTCTTCCQVVSAIVKTILHACPLTGNALNFKAQTPLICATICENVIMTSALLTRKVNIEMKDVNGHTALHHAARNGDTYHVSLLLGYNSSPLQYDNDGATPLHYAAARGVISSLRLLYSSCGYIDARTQNGQTAFMWAALYGTDGSIKAMLEQNPALCRREADKGGNTALHLAAMQDRVRIAKILVSNGWDFERQNSLRETPLLTAAKHGSLQTIRFLLYIIVNIYATDKDGNTALHLVSANNENLKALYELLDWSNETHINKKNHLGQTPLHCAVTAVAELCAEELLKHDADILIRNARGWDPMMCAIKSGCSWSLIALLLRKSPNMKCYSAYDHQTALSLANERCDDVLATFLRQNGALLPDEVIVLAVCKIQRWYRQIRQSSQAYNISELQFSPDSLQNTSYVTSIYTEIDFEIN